jgi:ribosomal protein S18 acetylase RimI-like enzyme
VKELSVPDKSREADRPNESVEMADGIRPRLLRECDCELALDYLRVDVSENLVLIDSVERLRNPESGSELPSHLYGAFHGERLEGIVLLRPCVALSHGMSDDVLNLLLPYLLRVPAGLLKGDRHLVEPVWAALKRTGREATIDRIEVAFGLTPERMVPAAPDLPGIARPARAEDLEELVYAARASLWEEDRPDPAEVDPAGFRRWVESRLSRARIVSDGGRTVFVAYADVRRSDGWLIQGVYTWPEARRKGFARRGMDAIVREAFASGASHVQLAVVDGNERASRLYHELGFEIFAELRTVLFS